MGYPQQPSSQPYGPPSAPTSRTNGLSVAALILGLTGFITCGFTSILAIVFGHVALGQIRRDGTDGHGMALGGVVLGWILTGAWVAFWALSWFGVISTALYSTVAPTPTVMRTHLSVPTQPGGTAPAGGAHAVVLEVEGADGATSIGTLTYMIGLQLKQESGVTLPYSQEISGDYPFSLIAQNAGQSGSITCRIKVDGQVVREARGEGPYGVCNARVDSP